jgi:hypothetical protein
MDWRERETARAGWTLAYLGWLFVIAYFIGEDLPSGVAAQASGRLILWVVSGALFLILFGASLGRRQLRREQRRETARAARAPT